MFNHSQSFGRKEEYSSDGHVDLRSPIIFNGESPTYAMKSY